jgi:hypothetical protein
MGALALVLCSCTSVPIKEASFYTDATPSGAIITHFYNQDISYLGQSAWDRLREGMTCLSASDFSNIKIEIEQLCSVTSCTQETNAAISDFFSRLREAYIRAGIIR